MQITPRTDERTVEINGKEYVYAAFARQLERELQESTRAPAVTGKALSSPGPTGTEQPVWTPPEHCVAWPVPKQTMVWAEIEHEGEKHRVPFWVPPGTTLAGHPNMLRKAGAVQPLPPSAAQSGKSE